MYSVLGSNGSMAMVPTNSGLACGTPGATALAATDANAVPLVVVSGRFSPGSVPPNVAVKKGAGAKVTLTGPAWPPGPPPTMLDSKFNSLWTWAAVALKAIGLVV